MFWQNGGGHGPQLCPGGAERRGTAFKSPVPNVRKRGLRVLAGTLDIWRTNIANTYTAVNIHCVFSTKHREPVMVSDVRERLCPYMGGIARENQMKALGIGGTRDHVHLLLSLHPILAVSKAVQLIKGGSSAFTNEVLDLPQRFAWQEGYGAFRVSVSGIHAALEYFRRQEGHHRRQTFQEEYLAFLAKHGIEYDERYVWGSKLAPESSVPLGPGWDWATTVAGVETPAYSRTSLRDGRRRGGSAQSLGLSGLPPGRFRGPIGAGDNRQDLQALSRAPTKIIRGPSGDCRRWRRRTGRMAGEMPELWVPRRRPQAQTAGRLTRSPLTTSSCFPKSATTVVPSANVVAFTPAAGSSYFISSCSCRCPKRTKHKS